MGPSMPCSPVQLQGHLHQGLPPSTWSSHPVLYSVVSNFPPCSLPSEWSSAAPIISSQLSYWYTNQLISTSTTRSFWTSSTQPISFHLKQGPHPRPAVGSITSLSQIVHHHPYEDGPVQCVNEDKMIEYERKFQVCTRDISVNQLSINYYNNLSSSFVFPPAHRIAMETSFSCPWTPPAMAGPAAFPDLPVLTFPSRNTGAGRPLLSTSTSGSAISRPSATSFPATCGLVLGSKCRSSEKRIIRFLITCSKWSCPRRPPAPHGPLCGSSAGSA